MTANFNFKWGLLAVLLLPFSSMLASGGSNACPAGPESNSPLLRSWSITDLSMPGKLVYGTDTLIVNSAQIFDFGANNFSTNHYEYFLTLSDGIYNGGVEYIGGTYSISIELLSLGNSFNYGDFQSCFFCGNSTAYSFVGHLFLIEDTNNDDQLDFNTDPFEDGDSGLVRINKTLDSTFLEIDFTMFNGKRLEGCHSGEFPIDPTTSVQEAEPVASEVKLFGNPVEGVLRFEYLYGHTEPFQYEVFSAMGDLVLRGRGEEAYQEIDLGEFPAGVYYLHVIGKNQDAVLRKVLVF